LLDSEVEENSDVYNTELKNLENYYGQKVKKILDYHANKEFEGRVVQIKKKMYQIRVPKVDICLEESGFDLLKVIDFNKPFLKEFSNAKLEVLKKSFGKSPPPKKPSFPANFVPLDQLKNKPPLFIKKPKIDFKPLVEKKEEKIRIIQEKKFEEDIINKQSKMEQLVQIMKTKIEPKKKEEVSEKNKLDAMFNDIFASD
jgi:hypothetical protein